ncbi:MAG: suppressor of fused domain protein [Planctomycetaceae bacterium]|nr:suppressor of fused domain protein [Planctomycetaceae bacterium]
MSIEFDCPECGHQIRVRDENAGRKGKCPKCGKKIVVPSADEETTEGGSVVYRHRPRTVPFDLAIGDSDNIEAISNHIEQHIGPIDSVWHELVSDLVHIDIHVVKPTEDRPWITLVTSGMSDAPMNVPSEAEHLRFAELMICLPPDWPLKEEDLKDESNYWPIWMLKSLARLPHEYDTWLSYGHTIPNGDPAQPYVPSAGFSSVLLLSPILNDDTFNELVISPDKSIHFFALFPLYAEELELKLNKGTEELCSRLEKVGTSELLNVARKNACKRRLFGLF